MLVSFVKSVYVYKHIQTNILKTTTVWRCAEKGKKKNFFTQFKEKKAVLFFFFFDVLVIFKKFPLHMQNRYLVKYSNKMQS